MGLAHQALEASTCGLWPFMGTTFMVAVDAHSKWPEVYEMPSITSPKLIAVLKHLFAKYGLPEQLVSDNGPQFTSAEFAHFMRANGIKHIHCSPPPMGPLRDSSEPSRQQSRLGRKTG